MVNHLKIHFGFVAAGARVMTGHSGKESHTKVKDGNLPMIEVICQRYAQIKIIAYYCNSGGLLTMASRYHRGRLRLHVEDT